MEWDGRKLIDLQLLVCKRISLLPTIHPGLVYKETKKFNL